MHLITSYDEMSRWHELAADDEGSPFELVAGGHFSHFRASGYSSMFTVRVIAACCRFTAESNGGEISAFLVR
jgi:hypothetical protein